MIELILDETKDEDQQGHFYSPDQSSDSNHFNDQTSEHHSNGNSQEKSSQMNKEKDKEKEKEKEKEKHIRRPMNAFMLFSQEQRAKIHLENPNRDNRNVSKILGEKWYSLSSQEQEQYKIRAKQLRNEHFKQNPSFKWSNSNLNKFHCNSSNPSNSKEEQEQCRRSARLQSLTQSQSITSNQSEKTLSPSCDRLQAFAQVFLPFPPPPFSSRCSSSKICTNMPKLTEQSSHQHFSPIVKASTANPSSSTDVITPVPIHPSSIQQMNSG